MHVIRLEQDLPTKNIFYDTLYYKTTLSRIFISPNTRQTHVTYFKGPTLILPPTGRKKEIFTTCESGGERMLLIDQFQSYTNFIVLQLLWKTLGILQLFQSLPTQTHFLVVFPENHPRTRRWDSWGKDNFSSKS